MKKYKLLISSVIAILLTGFVLTHSHWLPSKKASRKSSRHSEVRPAAGNMELLATGAGQRWLGGQPTHWRGYLLKN